MDKIKLREKIKEAKHKCLEMCVNAEVGHVTSAFSCVEIVASLYYEIMNINPQIPGWKDRDRFIMSKNHGSVITYPILADLGFFSQSELDFFLKNGSKLGIHSKVNVPGVDFAGGSLGIGLGVACGLAYAAKLNKENWITFTLIGDGECYEGSIWEAAMFAGHYNLNNLIVIIDRNQMCITNFTEKLLRLEPLADKWEAFNWETITINGHDTDQILAALSGVRERKNPKPLCIIADTIKGNGLTSISNKLFWHGAAPKGDQAKIAFEELEREVIK